MPARLTDAIAAYDVQSALLADWADDVADWQQPSALPGWPIETLVAHVAGSKQGLAAGLTTRGAGTPLPAATYVRAYAPAADQITAASEQVAADHDRPALLAILRTPTPVPDVVDAGVLAGPRGPITAIDFVRTRLVDLVVHVDDADRSTPGHAPRWHRPALADAVRALAEILAGQQPGRSVELRVPPFVAVQAIAGPRHTRGTPPNVVETSPVSWLRVATGRLPFADAVARGTVTAAGSRSDLTPYLPVLA